jgi:hypothetical protein
MRDEGPRRRDFSTGAAVAAIAAAVAVALVVTAAVLPPAPVPLHHVMKMTGAASRNAQIESVSSTANVVFEDPLDQMLTVLESVPADLKDADPATTPDYERRLADAIDAGIDEASIPGRLASGAVVVSAASFRTSNSGSLGAEPYVRLAANWFACGSDIVGLIVQYGVPVGRVIGWIKEARAIFGSLSGIVRAIAGGDFAVAVGDDAARVIEASLGVDGVIADCFG